MKLGEEKHRLLIENLPDAFAYHQIITDSAGNPVDYLFLSVNQVFYEMTGFPQDKVVGKKITEIQSEIVGADFDWIGTYGKVALTGESIRFEQHSEMTDRWYEITAYSDEPGYFVVVFRDISENKKAQAALSSMKWMLNNEKADHVKKLNANPESPYGKLTDLNTARLILDSIDETILNNIARDYLDLLETSTAIYEKNGDYALGIFSSGWCRLLDSASRKLCHTDDNRAALQSGQWLCHESCWTDASKVAIETGQPNDVRCSGGLHLYAIPIWADKQVVGAINFGYGDPPQQPDELQKIAEKYSVDHTELTRLAKEYESRPLFIIELAKERLAGTARIIGAMVERKQAGETLQRANENLRITLNSIGDAVISTDTDGCIVNMNPVSEKLTGWTLDDAQGKLLTDVLRIFHDRTREPAANPVKRVLESGLIVGLANHTVLIARDGREYQIADSAAPIRDGEGKITGVVMVFRDVTEEYRVQEVLRVSEERLELAMVAADDGLWDWDVSADQVYFDARYYTMAGYDPDEFPPAYEQWAKRVHPHDLALANRAIQDHLTGKTATSDIEFRFRRKDETWMWIRGRAKIVKRDQDGKALRMVGTHSDITERKQAEEALRNSEERFRLLAENAQDLIYRISFIPTQHFEYVSPAAKNLTGYTPEDHYADPNLGFKLVHPDDVHILKSIAIEKKPPEQSIILRWVKKNGDIIWTEQRNVPIYDENGTMTALEGIARDITDQKIAEEALRESEKRFRYIAESTPLPLSIVDDQGNYEYLNPMFTEVFGYTLEHIPTKKEWLELAYPDPHHRQEALGLWKDDLKTGHGVIIPRSFRITCKDHTEKEIVFRTVIMDNGKILQICVDITERTQVAQKLADYTLELEQLYHQLDEELNKARQVHERSLLTEFPHVKGLSFAAHYQPAKTLGGDFYDVIRTGNKIVFYLSDVSGHGLDGAMLSVFVKYTIKSYISFTPPEIVSPANILKYLAEQFHQENYPEELYICVFMAVLDLESMKLTYCGAGFQNPPLVQLGNGDKLKLNTKGLFITSFLPVDMLKLHEKFITLTPGTSIFCNTDGLTEQGNNGTYYMDRLPEHYFKNAHLPPHLVTQAIVEDFRRFNNGSLQGKDDISFLVLQVDHEEKKTHHLELASDFSELMRLRKDVSTALTGINEANIIMACLYELAANAIEHGNRFDPDKTVSVEISITNSYLQATVQDQGAGFHWREKIDKPIELDGNQERGRGIAMTRMCSEHFYYNDKGNSATLVVKTQHGE